MVSSFSGKGCIPLSEIRMAQVMDLTFEEVTLRLFELQTCSFQFLKNNFNVFKMLLWGSTEDDDIIQVRHCKVSANLVKPLKLVVGNMLVLLLNQTEQSLNSYFPKGVTKAVFALDSSSRFM